MDKIQNVLRTKSKNTHRLSKSIQEEVYKKESSGRTKIKKDKNHPPTLIYNLSKS